ncbi:MAG: protein translocase subunit SecD [Pseudomonadota bacterium]
MNQYPLWKNALVLLVVLTAAVLALPNLFGKSPAVMVSPESGNASPALLAESIRVVQSAGVDSVRGKLVSGRAQLRFDNLDDQRLARSALDDALGNAVVIAPNLVSSAPDWLKLAEPMYLGLDLRGGVHFLMQVDMDAAIDKAYATLEQDMRVLLRDEGVRYRSVGRGAASVSVVLRDAANRDSVLTDLRRQYPETTVTVDEADPAAFGITFTEFALEEARTAALEKNISTLRNRVNQLGVAEPVIQRQGADRIVVQLPGVQDTTQAKEVLGATATLEYRLVYGDAADWFAAEETGRIPASAKLFRQRDTGEPILLNRRVIVSGDEIKDASSGIDSQTGSPAVFVNLNGTGANRMQRVTADNVGEPMAVVYKESRYERLVADDGSVTHEPRVDEEVINVATIRDVLSHRFQTTGLGSEEARHLSLLIRAGSLSAPVYIVEERTVGPSLGEDNIRRGFTACVVGLLLVMGFMLWYYRFFGLLANLALIVNIVMVVAVLSVIQATLTLPGIAGVVLTVGMAVDANVLIFERIREELRNGSPVQQAIHAGYDRAVGTIADANITTLIAALVLFAFGTGAIQGFAVTLSIGIATSMFTAIVGTRALVNLRYGGRRVKALAI